jgi:hypothetical protein
MSERGPEFAAGDAVAGRRHELTAEGTFTDVLLAAPLRDRPRWRQRLGRLLWRAGTVAGRTQIGAADDFGDGDEPGGCPPETQRGVLPG